MKKIKRASGLSQYLSFLKKSIARFGFVKRTIVFRLNQIPYNLNLKQYVYGKPIRKNLLYKLKIRKCD